MVLAAATAVVVVAQAAIVAVTRPRRLRESLFLAVPSIGIIALLIVAWRTVA